MLSIEYNAKNMYKKYMCLINKLIIDLYKFNLKCLLINLVIYNLIKLMVKLA